MLSELHHQGRYEDGYTSLVATLGFLMGPFAILLQRKLFGLQGNVQGTSMMVFCKTLFKFAGRLQGILGVKIRALMLTAQIITGWVPSLYLTYPGILDIELGQFREVMMSLVDWSGLMSIDLSVLIPSRLQCSIGEFGHFLFKLLVLPCVMILLSISTAAVCKFTGGGNRRFVEILAPLFYWLTYLPYGT